ncbi:MAG TPA: hypothetical protein VF498_02080 [Anaerolineales bacterium]
MDWLTFAAEVIKALAWPVTVAVILYFLRGPLFQLVPMLQRFRFMEFELDFGQQVQELANDLQKEIPPLPERESNRELLQEHFAKLAPLSPRAVVLEAWLQLEEAAIQAGKRRDLKLTSRELRSPILLGHYLAQAGILDDSKQEIYHRLRNLRNAAAHASDFSFDPKSAIEYADLAVRLAEYIRSA